MQPWKLFRTLCDEYQPESSVSAYDADRDWLDEVVKWEAFDKEYTLPTIEEVSLSKDGLPLFKLQPIREIQETKNPSLPPLPNLRLVPLPKLETIEIEVIKDGKESTTPYQKSEVPTKEVIRNEPNRPTIKSTVNKSLYEQPSIYRRESNRRQNVFSQRMATRDDIRDSGRRPRPSRNGTNASPLRKRGIPKRSQR